MSYLKLDVKRFKNRIFAVLGTYDDAQFDDTERIIINLKNDIPKCYELQDLTDTSYKFIKELEDFVFSFEGKRICDYSKNEIKKIVFKTLNRIERCDVDEL